MSRGKETDLAKKVRGQVAIGAREWPSKSSGGSKMEIPLKAQVECTDGVVGAAWYVLVNPVLTE